jgi:uncharacterized protein
MTSPVAGSRVVVLHGYQASPDAHWFDWLTADLARDGVPAQVPALPSPHGPVLADWVAAARAAIGTPDEGTVVVGHSLGCITALHALSATPGDWRLGGLVLAAGFDTGPRAVPEVAEFTLTSPDHARVVAGTRHRHVIGSDDDPVVEPALTRALAERLDATFDVVPGGGHLLGKDGFTTLPVLRDRVRAALGLPVAG